MSSQAPLQEPQEATIKAELLDTPEVSEARTDSPPPSVDSTIVHKVSNSDDEDSVEQARAIRRGLSTTKGSMMPLSSVLPRLGNQTFQSQRPSTVIRRGHPAQTLGTEPFTMIRRNEPLLYGSPYAMAQREQRRLSLHNEVPRCPSLPAGFRNPAQDCAKAPWLQQPSSRSSDLLSVYSPAAAFAAPSRAGAPTKHSSIPRQYTTRPSDGDEFFSLSLKEMMKASKDTSQLPVEAISRLPLTDHIGTRSERNSARALPDVTLLPSYKANEDKQRPVKLATSKHTATPPRDDAAKRARISSDFGPALIDLPYQTMKVINMPARGDLTPGQDLPEPTPDNLPYGDTENHQSSMLLYWLDEQELSYREAFALFNQKFPNETTYYESFRRRHIKTLQRLARKYGLKPASEIELPGPNVLRRGQQAGARYSTIGGSVLEPAAMQAASNNSGEHAAVDHHSGTTPQLWVQPQANTHPKRQGHGKKARQPLATRGLLLACIVVWKDIEGVSLEQIQERLAGEFDWKLSINTVKKLYYDQRPRIYDVRQTVADRARQGSWENNTDTIEQAQGATDTESTADTAGASVVHRQSL